MKRKRFKRRYILISCLTAALGLSISLLWLTNPKAIDSAYTQQLYTLASGTPRQIFGIFRSYREQQMSFNNDISNPGSATNSSNTSANKKSTKSGAISGSSSNTSSPSQMIAIYVSASPSDPGSLTELDTLSAAGFNAVLNYTIWDGSPSQVKSYLDRAAQRNIKVIFSLKDFYNSGGYISLSSVSQYGSSFEQAALNIVTTFKDHPATYGWYISDEQPAEPSEINSWLPTLTTRYQKIKQIDPTHKVMMVMQCYPGTFMNDTANVQKLAAATDDFGFDTYPVPYQSLSLVGSCAKTLTNANIPANNRWMILQSFSWKTYPDVPTSSGYDASQARYPTLNELQQMVAQAKTNGVTNIMFYSYFDMKNDTANYAQQWQNLSSVVSGMK